MISTAQHLGGREASRTALSRNGGQRIAGTWSTGIPDLSRAGRNIVDEIVSWSLQKRGCQVIQLGVPGVEVVADAQVQGEVLRDLPVILEISSDFPVSPVTNAGR